MMSPSPADGGSAAAAAASWATTSKNSSNNPRRVPAHQSVSLRRQSLPSHSKTVARGLHPNGQDTSIVRAERPQRAERPSPPSDGSEEHDGEPSRSNVQTWFDHSNRHPRASFSHSMEGDDLPYFLPRSSSNDSNDTRHARPRVVASQVDARLRMGRHSGTNGSSADDYRSVIDDLTIENKKLKEKLKKIQKPYAPSLDKDRLFEVKIHGLSARKRRQLEETLRAFTSSLDESSEEGSPKEESNKHGSKMGDAEHKPATSSSTSHSRPLDSAYASLSISGKTSSANLNEVSTSRKSKNSPEQANEENVQTFLHAIPHGLLPKHSLVLTERQKKKLVVERLERLFTGRDRVAGASGNQPLQQQEVAKSAARDERPAGSSDSPLEGLREANFYANQMKFGLEPGKLSVDLSSDSRSTRDITDSSDDVSADDASPEQRPTRPLDLDPDRAQIPSDNVEYIRHLGMSTPQLLIEDLRDVGADAHGWIYLNLLINMAQLHIINVTPDFVRHAVQDVSEKFQLSKDGNKIRWRGGSRGTQLQSGSDSGSNSATNRSPHGSDSADDGGGKRRRIGSGRFAAIPVHSHGSRTKAAKVRRPSVYQYRPLFNHKSTSSSDSQSSNESESKTGYEDDSRFGRNSHLPRTSNERSRSRSKGRKQRDHGPMIFYSGAGFCTDLSGDRDIARQLADVKADSQEFGDDTLTASTSSMPPIIRTTSGSALPFRPFNELRPCMEAAHCLSVTDSLGAESSDSSLFVEESEGSSVQRLTWQAFEASGLGGTQPADHFAIQVGTRRTNTSPPVSAPLSKFSAPSSKSKKFLHSIPQSALDSFARPDTKGNEESIASRREASMAFPSRSGTKITSVPVEELPIKTEIISVDYINFQPSSLPEPAGYYSTFCTSEDDSECYSSSAGVSHLIRHKIIIKRRKSTAGPIPIEVTNFSSDQDNDGEADGDGEEPSSEGDDGSEESEVSVDMLAHESGENPEKFALQERGFNLAIHGTRGAPPKSAVATVAESEFSDGST